MKKFINKKVIGITSILLVFLVVLFIVVSNSSFAAGTNTCPGISLERYQQALVNTAYAFYFHGNDFQYDTTNITDYNGYYNPTSDDKTNKLYYNNYRMRRSFYNYRPEDGTDYNYDVKYFVCSEFVNSVFYNTFYHYNGYNKKENYLINSNNRIAWSPKNMISI